MKFGEFLVQRGIISQEQLEKALLIQKDENEQGYHRMIGYIILSDFHPSIETKDGLYELLREWESGKE